MHAQDVLLLCRDILDTWLSLGLGAKGGPWQDLLPGSGPRAVAGSTTGLRLSRKGWVMFVPSVPPWSVWQHLAQWIGAPGISQQLAEAFQVHPSAISSSPAAQPHFNWK